jgi:hypothetical protein
MYGPSCAIGSLPEAAFAKPLSRYRRNANNQDPQRDSSKRAAVEVTRTLATGSLAGARHVKVAGQRATDAGLAGSDASRQLSATPSLVNLQITVDVSPVRRAGQAGRGCRILIGREWQHWPG